MHNQILRFCLLWNCLFACFVLHAQKINETKEELYHSLSTAKDDTAKITIFKKLSGYYYEAEVDSLKYFADEMIALSQKLKDDKGFIAGYRTLGIYYNDKGDQKKSEVNYLKALEIAKRINNPLILSKLYNDLAILYMGTDLHKALNYAMQSVKTAEQINDTGNIMYAYNTLGVLFNGMRQFDQALHYDKLSLEMGRNRDSPTGIAATLHNIGEDYHSLKMDSLAEIYIDSALAINLKYNNKSYLNANYSVLTDIYLNRKDSSSKEIHFASNLEKALDFMLKGLKLSLEQGKLDDIASASLNVGAVYYELKDIKLAEKYYNECLRISDSAGFPVYKMEALRSLVQLYENTNHKDKAIDYMHQLLTLNDSLKSRDLNDKLAESQKNFEVSERDYKIKTLQETNRLKAEEASLNLKLRNLFIAASVLLLLFAVYVIITYRSKRKNAEQQALLLERERIRRELHDEMGSTLSSIQMMSEIAKKKIEMKKEDAVATLEKISSNSATMQETMSDIVWTLNAQNTTMENLITRLRSFATEITEAKNIALHFETDERLCNIQLSLEERKNIYLIAKEAVNNAVKYADCSLCHIRFKKSNDIINVLIEDNGKGFDTSVEQNGNGLRNMQSRAREMNAELQLQSEPGMGTAINLTLKLPNPVVAINQRKKNFAA